MAEILGHRLYRLSGVYENRRVGVPEGVHAVGSAWFDAGGEKCWPPDVGVEVVPVQRLVFPAIELRGVLRRDRFRPYLSVEEVEEYVAEIQGLLSFARLGRTSGSGEYGRQRLRRALIFGAVGALAGALRRPVTREPS